MSDDQKKMPPQERSPEGGSKDTNDLSDIKGVQDQGMAEKARQANQTPEEVLGTDVPRQPQKR